MTEIFTALPLVALPIVFVGMALLLWQAQRDGAELAKLALSKLNNGGSAPPSPAAVAPARPALAPSLNNVAVGPAKSPVIPPFWAAQPAKPAAPAAAAPFDAAPPWFAAALHEVGFEESGNNQGIGRYIALAHCGAEGDPWCAIFANAMLEQAGVAGTRSAASQSFRESPLFVPLAAPALGALAVFWRGARDSGLGHVGFYRGENADSVWTLGGNENDKVQIEALPKNAARFGLIGYWWPKAVPLPSGGPLLMPAGSPLQVQAPPAGAPAPSPALPAHQSAAPAHQSGITATMFSGPQSAYGGPIDDNAPGVALPFRFEGARPHVKVENPRTGQSVICEICDVGPWNTHDPYWQAGARPQAESGTDMTGRKTNRAGIDLTLAAAKAISIDGKGLVDWDFVAPPSS